MDATRSKEGNPGISLARRDFVSSAPFLDSNLPTVQRLNKDRKETSHLVNLQSRQTANLLFVLEHDEPDGVVAAPATVPGRWEAGPSED